MQKSAKQEIFAEIKSEKTDQTANDNLQRRPRPEREVIKTKRMFDLEWQINFTEQKLRQWKELDNHHWVHFDKLHKKAKINYRELHDQAHAELYEITEKVLMLRAF